MIITSRRRRSEPQVLVLGAPIGYAPPAGEVHSEYPKFVQLPKQRSVIVNNSEEERAVLEGAQLKPVEAPIVRSDAPVVSLQGSNNERDMLLKIAQSRGITVDHRWTTRKLRVVLDRACSERREGPSWL